MDTELWESKIRLLGRITQSEHEFLLETLRSSPSELQCVHDDEKWHLLSHYTQVLSEGMPVDEINYLKQRKALSLPCPHIRDELFANFLRYVYPSTPFLDIDNFYLRNLDGDNLESGKRSLLLTQAVLYAGSQFTDLSTLKELGFDSRRKACQHFHGNVKMIRCLGIDKDVYSNISACLLMNGSQSDAGEEINPRYWIDQAVSLAFRIGLHRRNPKYQTDSSRARLQTRLWWSCYTKDRLSSFPNLERSRIMDTEYSITALRRQDFEKAILHPKITIFAEDFVREYNALVLSSVQLVRLCILIGRVVETLQIAEPLHKDLRDYVSSGSNTKTEPTPVFRPVLNHRQQHLSVEDRAQLAGLRISRTGGRLQLIQSSFSRIVCGVSMCVGCHWPGDGNPSITNVDCQQEKSIGKILGSTRARSMASLSRLLGEVLRKDLVSYLPTEAAGFLNAAIRLHHPRDSIASGHSTKGNPGIRVFIEAERILRARSWTLAKECVEDWVETPAGDLAQARSEGNELNDGFTEQSISPS
ncbi:uncharacterized protein Z519_09218 [Cladophialophora bantiana CBS 173.52]|uniref:Xylanolytic transcriptional activator regulatory domain-containing protein n=1 Tax=Cladophialophora bantiana (strain ATCC 10958 / CBS 173.52 / CDC B-1940 / NIH 8579) TaxID=1442370 RepID=A0A0D2EKQ2_CLAB1|nr:uncharacterized protein Z519_09218 [Cladophialophora bantiana CBS 173.52]KIW90571.1 hypothetical protein Z519_09218 [Cladophialophora bantiana CBS 173.52]